MNRLTCLASLYRSTRSLTPLHNNGLTTRPFSSTHLRSQEYAASDPKAHRNFYKVHGRAIAKAFTLAFFSYQVFYWAWMTLETEQLKDEKEYEIKSLEGEVRLLEEGRKSHRPGEVKEVTGEKELGKRVLEERRP